MAMTVAATAVSDGCIKVTVTGLQQASYARLIVCYYKLASESTYVKWGQSFIYANSAPNSQYTYYVGDRTEQKLIPGKTYKIRVQEQRFPSGDIIGYKDASAKTEEATGNLIVETTPSSITGSIVGLKQTASYDRSVSFGFNDERDYYGISSSRNVNANDPLVDPVEITLDGLSIRPGKEFYCWAELSHVDSGYTIYKQIGFVKVLIPYDNISRASIIDHHYSAPDETLIISGKTYVYPETALTTTLELYLRRQNGEVIDCGEVSFSSSWEKEVDVSWLLDDETIALWVESTEPNTYVTAVSPEYTVTLQRLFRWDLAKTMYGEFNITANEWNRMIDYGQAAHELYPDYFPVSFQINEVETGDPLLASDATSIGMAGVTVHQYDQIKAWDSQRIEDSLQDGLRRAVRAQTGAQNGS